MLVQQTDSQGITRFEKALVVDVAEDTVDVSFQGKRLQVAAHCLVADINPEHNQVGLSLGYRPSPLLTLGLL